MSLFPWQQPPAPRHAQPTRPAAPPRPAPRPAPHHQPRRQTLPAFMYRLSEPLCHHHSHPLPSAMRCIGEGTTHRGQPQVIYACPLCNTRQGWVVDYYSGQPIKLWQRDPNTHA